MDSSGDVSPSGFEHHVVPHAGKEFWLGLVGTCRGVHVGDADKSVVPGAEYQHWRGYSPGFDAAEHRIDRGGANALRLGARHTGFDDGVGRVCAEEVIASKRRGVDEFEQCAAGESLDGDPGVAAPDAQRQSEDALRRDRPHQYRGRGTVIFEVPLHHEAAQGMADEDRLATQVVGRGTDIVDIVGDGT